MTCHMYIFVVLLIHIVLSSSCSIDVWEERGWRYTEITGKERQGKSSGRTIKIIIILKPNIQNEERLEGRRVRRESDTRTTGTTDLFLLPIPLHPILLLLRVILSFTCSLMYFKENPHPDCMALSFSLQNLFSIHVFRGNRLHFFFILLHTTHEEVNFISVSYNSSLSWSVLFLFAFLSIFFSLPSLFSVSLLSLSSPKKGDPCRDSERVTQK